MRQVDLDEVIKTVIAHTERYGGKKPADRALGLTLGTCERILREKQIPFLSTCYKLGVVPEPKRSAYWPQSMVWVRKRKNKR